jgi:hypothetical protein
MPSFRPKSAVAVLLQGSSRRWSPMPASKTWEIAPECSYVAAAFRRHPDVGLTWLA